jgi:DNA-binding CsgD family transcriptional regulator
MAQPHFGHDLKGGLPLLDESLQRFLPQLYDVQLGSGSWEPLLHEIKEYLKARAVALMSHDFIHNVGSIHHAIGYNQRYLRSYASYYADRNVWLDRERNYRPSGRIHLGENLVRERRLVTTQFYTEWLLPQDLHHRLCAVLVREHATAVFLEVMRPRAWPGFDRHDIRRCRVLLPHLQRALRMQHRLSELEIARDAAFDALDHLPWGVVLVDNHGHRVVANRRAQEILVAGDGLTIQGEALRAVQADESARLGRLLSHAVNRAADQPPPPGGALSITRPSGAHPLSVMVVPLRTKGEALGDRAPAAAVFVSDPEIRPDSNQQHLRQLYALTVAEARLAAWLAQGKSVNEAAAAMGITVNTARAYLKRIYDKTGVRRQPELVRVLLSLPRLSQHNEPRE